MPTSFRPRPAGCSRRIQPCRSTRATSTRTAARRQRISNSPSVLPAGYKPTYLPVDAASGQRHRHRRAAESGEPGTPRVCDAAGAHQIHHVRAAPARAGRAHVPRSDLGPQHPDAQLRRLRPQLGETVRLRRRCGAAAAEGHHRPLDRFPGHDRREQDPATRGTGPEAAADRSPTCSSIWATRCRSPKSSSRPRWRSAAKNMKNRNDYDIGCPLCWAPPISDHVGVAAVDRVSSHATRCRSLGAVAALFVDGVAAQTRFTYSSGQTVSPVYEGWMPIARRRILHDVLRVHEYELAGGVRHSVGPDNNIEPGGPDQGQPTHFYPRRNPFLFTIRVPKDFWREGTHLDAHD